MISSRRGPRCVYLSVARASINQTRGLAHILVDGEKKSSREISCSVSVHPPLDDPGSSLPREPFQLGSVLINAFIDACLGSVFSNLIRAAGGSEPVKHESALM
ncbi:hypothetical protein NDU88_010996 [Pleurodeles waltl]|uniref:Uncharacterized protein n=1 Tax=Pleurodeles waltl TaxID=8319 RepID=A0AAV7QXY4_PLEWA|nr:hypothetical protein NDU88_010996 [Pleurodeles waltl]